MIKYPINKRRLPRKNGTLYRIKGILRAIDEEFAISSDLLKISIEKYNNYIFQLEENEFISRISKNDYNGPENFNLTIKGHKFLKSKGVTMETSHGIKTPFTESNITIKKEF